MIWLAHRVQIMKNHHFWYQHCHDFIFIKRISIHMLKNLNAWIDKLCPVIASAGATERRTFMFECSVMFAMFLNNEMFDVRIFANIQMFESSNVRMFANIRMFGCSMFANVRFFKSSNVRMFSTVKIRKLICSEKTWNWKVLSRKIWTEIANFHLFGRIRMFGCSMFECWIF